MSYLKDKQYVNVDNDISIIDPEMETKPKFTIASEILEDTIFNRINLLFMLILEIINLIFLGHENSNNNYIKFNFYIIGTYYVYLFGFYLNLGIIKSLNFDIERYNHYILLKKLTYYFSILIIFPFSLLSYFILNYIYSSKDNLINEHINRIIKEYILYSSIFCQFLIMFLLNLKFFQKNFMRSQAIWFSFIFYVIYILCLYCFLYKLHLGYKAITLSLTISSFISYYFSNDTISEDFKHNHKKTKNFYFIPNNSKIFDEYLLKHYNEIFKISLKLYIDRFPYAITYLFSFFIGKYFMSCNIILLNLFLILHAISKGLSATIKNYIQYSSIIKKNSHLAKIRFIKIFTIVNFCTSLFFCFLIFLFDKNICYIYISHPHEIIKKFFNKYLYWFIFTIFIDFFKQELEGYIKGINTRNNILIYKIISIFVFLPLGFALCFLLNFGLKGFWMAILISICIQCVPHSINVYKNYEVFLI